MFWYANGFWLFILVIVVFGIVSRVIRSHQREKTIRLAIEKGVTLDPAALNSLSQSVSNPQDARAGLLTGSIITFFVGLGIGVMGFFIGNGHAIYPLLGVGALMWCIAAGLFVAHLAIPRRNP